MPPSPQPPKHQNFEKWKNLLEIHHFAHKYQKSQLYDVWFLRYGVRLTEFFAILHDCFLNLFCWIFCPFTPPLLLTTRKIKIKKKIKKHLEISSFYINVPKIMIRWCRVPKIWCITDVIVISHSLQNENFVKTTKKLLKNRNWTFPVVCYFTPTLKFVSYILARIVSWKSILLLTHPMPLQNWFVSQFW